MKHNECYACFHFEKVKDFGQLTAIGNHNRRIRNVENADKEKADLNRTYVDIGDLWSVDTPEGKTKDDLTFTDAFKARIAMLPYYKNHKIRPDAVYAYEMIMSYTRNGQIDPYAWAEKSLEWVRRSFDKAGDGYSNILYAALHMDESTPHLHVVVVPIDEECRLNASAYTNGSRVLSQLQTSYADAVSEFGLQRGVANSSAKHKDIRKLYATLNNVKIDHPMPREGQSAKEYYDEIQEYIETRMLSGYKEIEDKKTRALQEVDRQRQESREFIRKDLEAERAIIKHEKKQYQKELDIAKKDLAETQDQFEILCRQLEATQLVFQNLTQDKEDYEEFKRIRKGVRALQMLDPEEAEKYIYYTDQVIVYGEEHDIDMIEIEPELD